jgi:hypothetical protein
LASKKLGIQQESIIEDVLGHTIVLGVATDLDFDFGGVEDRSIVFGLCMK